MTDKIFSAEQIFLLILNMSLTGSFVILSVLAARVILRRAPRIFSYCLWAAALFRLLCPVSFSAAFSPLNALPVSSTEHGRVEYLSDDIWNFGDSAISETNGAGTQDTPPRRQALSALLQTAVSPKNAVRVCSAIYLSGVCAMALYGLFSLLGLKRKLKNASWERENIYLTEKKTTPFVMGIIRPKIYLPADLREEEKDYLLLHEQIHIKRLDHIVKMISFLTLCLHWFNPLVWAAFFLSGKDMEMSCDEAVIRRLGADIKKKYTSSLLSMATGKRIINGVPLTFGEGDTNSRIRNVLRYKKPAALGAGFAAVLCAAAAVILSANPSAAAKDQQAEASGQTYYGVVTDFRSGDAPTGLLYLPGIGEIKLPKTERIDTYFEGGEDRALQTLQTGDLVQILFPTGAEVRILETSPASFSLPAESVTAVWEGFRLQYTDRDSYRLTFPSGAMPELAEAKPNDTLSIFWEVSEDMSYRGSQPKSENSALLVTTPILEVSANEYGGTLLTIDLSLSEVRDVLAGFGFCLRFSL